MKDDGNKPEGNSGVVQDLINSGAEIAGGAIGGALGFLAGGPAGAAVLGAGGSIAAIALKHIGAEVGERVLSSREKVRVGGVLAIAASQIEKRLKAGEKTRTDNFFTKSDQGRSGAEEIAESVLLKSQKEPEEKKIPYMGYLLSNISFDSQINVEMGHQIIKSAEQLTYRQLCILKLSVSKQSYGLRAEDYRNHSSFQKELYQVLYECLDLYHRGFINFGGNVAFGPTDVKPAGMTVQGLGADIYNLMALSSIPDQELQKIALQLK